MRGHTRKPLKGKILLTTSILLTTLSPSYAANEALNKPLPPTANITAANTINPAPTMTTAMPPAPSQTTAATTPSTVPLNQPNMRSEALINFVAEAVKAVYSYDFKNYKKQIQSTQPYFTEAGWRAFYDALTKSNNLKIVEDKKLVASATVGKPTILEEGVKKGRYTWKVQLPVYVTYENESKLIKQNLNVTLLLARANTPSGVGISHFIAQIVPQTPQPPANSPSPTSPGPNPQDVPPPLNKTPDLDTQVNQGQTMPAAPNGTVNPLAPNAPMNSTGPTNLPR